MDLILALIIAVLIFGFWFLLNKRVDDIETDLETLSKSIGKEDLLTKIRHRTQQRPQN